MREEVRLSFGELTRFALLYFGVLHLAKERIAACELFRADTGAPVVGDPQRSIYPSVSMPTGPFSEHGEHVGTAVEWHVLLMQKRVRLSDEEHQGSREVRDNVGVVSGRRLTGDLGGAEVHATWQQRALLRIMCFKG